MMLQTVLCVLYESSPLKKQLSSWSLRCLCIFRKDKRTHKWKPPKEYWKLQVSWTYMLLPFSLPSLFSFLSLSLSFSFSFLPFTSLTYALGNSWFILWSYPGPSRPFLNLSPYFKPSFKRIMVCVHVEDKILLVMLVVSSTIFADTLVHQRNTALIIFIILLNKAFWWKFKSY